MPDPDIDTPAALGEASKASLKFEFECLETVLNSLDALVYVADMETNELLFVSKYGLTVWGDPRGRKCYEYLQAGQASACSFCTNAKLVDTKGEPNGVLVWEFQNTVTGRWYQCRDQAIRWIDGRLVRLEIATDISERKEFELQLDAARAQAEELARVDVLTKVQNRRAFHEHIERLYSYMQRKPTSLCLVMLDIDYFKRINDTWGHAFGDEVLIAMCQRLREGLREFDQLFRIGGEEFVITLFDCDGSSALELVERLRSGIEKMVLQTQGASVPLTCSFGIAEYRPGLSIDALLANADGALYAAKQGGRNLCCIADGHAH